MKRREAAAPIAVSSQGGRPLAPGEVRAPAKAAAPPPPVRKATIAKLFRTPDGHPNALDVSPEGFWIGEQVTDRIVLMDISGKVIRAFQTDCHNCSGLAAGDPDPHGLAMLNGKLYFCDAGIHPGWERDKSPHTGWLCRVDVA